MRGYWLAWMLLFVACAGQDPEPRSQALDSNPGRFSVHSTRAGELEMVSAGGSIKLETQPLSRGDGVEHLRTTEAGVEQSWSFDQRPSGGGDLVIRVRVTGPVLAFASATGLGFRDPRSRVGFRYGPGTWIDASGLRTPVLPSFEDDHIVLRVAAAVVDSARYPAVLDPVLSPDFAIDAPVPAPSTTYSAGPGAAFDGTHTFVAWKDGRAGGPHIYGARVDQNGTVLDPDGILLYTGTDAGVPAVAWNGSHHLIAWAGASGVRAVRINSDGGLAAATPLVIDPMTNAYATSVNVVSDGQDFLVVWHAPTLTGASRYAVRVTDTGGVVDSPASNLGPVGDYLARVPLAFDGTDYWLAWVDAGYSAVRAGRRNPTTLASGDGAGIIVDTAIGAHDLGLACAGTVCGVSWLLGYQPCDDCVGTPQQVNVAIGLPYAPKFNLLIGYGVAQPSIASNGSDFLVTWFKSLPGPEIAERGVRVQPDGTILDSPALELGTFQGQSSPATVWTQTSYLAARQVNQLTSKIYGTRVTSAGAVLDAPGVLISAEMVDNSEWSVALARGTSNYLATWLDSRNGRQDVYAARITDAGGVLDDPAIEVRAVPGLKGRPAVEFGAGYYLVAWVEGRSLLLRRVRASDGAVLDPTPITLTGVGLSGGAFDPLVAFDGSNFLVVWTDRGVGAAWMYVELLAARITPGGTLIDPSPLRLTAENSNYLRGLSFDGTNYMFLWQHQDVWGWGDDQGLFAGWLAPDGSRPLPASQIAPFEYAVGTSGYGGGAHLVVWPYSGGNGWNLRGRRMNTAGATLDALPGFVISDEPRSQWRPKIAFDGADLIVVWEDQRMGAETIFGARVSPVDGTVRDPDGIRIQVSPTSSTEPEVTSDGIGNSLVAYAHAAPGAPQRIHARFMDDQDLNLPNGKQCITDADCKNGSCADGYCCDAPCDQPCEACNVPNDEGNCQPVAIAVPGDRSACAGAGTACAGTCDGASTACVYPNTSTACRTASCQNGYEIDAANCDGAGGCAYVFRFCQPYVCGPSACLDACDDNADCVAGYVCNAGTCKLALGTYCTDNNQCASGFCTDSRCCESDCSGQCSYCQYGTGKCLAQVGPPVGSRLACATDGSSCGGFCNGSSMTECFYGTWLCRSGSCADGVETEAANCAAGSCPAAVTNACAPFVCGASACLDACADDSACAGGAYCDATVCKEKHELGEPCNEDRECDSGKCVDDVCCSSDCTDQCASCNGATPGTCLPILGAPVGGRPACAGTGPCTASCNGIDATACQIVTTNCAPYACGSDGCLTSCDDDGDCAPDHHCEGTSCVTGARDGAVDAGPDASPPGPPGDSSSENPADEAIVEPVSSGCGCGASRPDGAVLIVVLWALGRRRRPRR